jgi:hypothetical protein
MNKKKNKRGTKLKIKRFVKNNGEKMKILIIFLTLISSHITLSAEYCFNKVEVTSDYIFVSRSKTNDIGTTRDVEEQSLFLTTNPEVLQDIRNTEGKNFCIEGRVEHEKKEIELYVPCEGFSSCRKVEFIHRTIFATKITHK